MMRYLVTTRVLGGTEQALLEKNGTQRERKPSIQQRKRCSVPNIYCHNCFNFSTTTQVDLIYSVVKQQNVTNKVP